ncbi:hypothetical protein JCM10212_000284 [Sporobolomyces blumeae]
MATSLIFDSIPPRRAHLDGVPDSGDGVLIGVLEMRPTLYRFLRSCDYTRTTLGPRKQLVKRELYIFVRVIPARQSLVERAAIEGDWEAMEANWVPREDRFARHVRIMSLDDLHLEAVRYIDKLFGPKSETKIGGLESLDGLQEARLFDTFREVRRTEPAPSAEELKLSTNPTPLQRQALNSIKRRVEPNRLLCEELVGAAHDFKRPEVWEANESTDDEPATGSTSSSGPSATATSRIGANHGTTADKTTSSPTTTRAKRKKKGPFTRLASFFKKIVGRGFRSKRQEASKASKASKASNLSKADRSRGGR